MAENNDLFAPPSEDELKMFAPPSKEEIATHTPSLVSKVGSALSQKAKALTPDVSPETKQSLLDTGLDFAKGTASGLTFGGLDELAGLAGAPLEALYNKFNPTSRELEAKGFKEEKPSLTDLYRQNQQMVQKDLAESEKRSPWAYTAGQLAGGITSAPVLGVATEAIPGVSQLGAGATNLLGKAGITSKAGSLLDIAKNEGKLKALGELGLRGAKAYGTALPAIAIEGALSSKEGGVLTPEERSKLAEDVTGSALFGLPAVAGLTGATEVGGPLLQKASEKIAERVSGSPLLSTMKTAYEHTKETGLNPKNLNVRLNTELGQVGPSELDNLATNKIFAEIMKADREISEDVSNSLNKATAAGKTVDLTQDSRDAIQNLSQLATRFPDIKQNPKAKAIYGKLVNANGTMTPNEVKDLLGEVDNYIKNVKPAALTDPNMKGLLNNLFEMRSNISNNLKTSVPEYGSAAERMTKFRELVPETILSGKTPQSISKNYFGSNPNAQEDLFHSLKDLIQTAVKTNSPGADTAYVNTIKGMKQFEQQDLARQAAGKIQNTAFQRPVSDIENDIRKYSTSSVARGSMDAIKPQAGAARTLTGGLIGAGAETGRSMLLNLSGKMGLVANYAQNTKNPVAKLSKAIYNAPDDAMRSFSSTLKANPGLERYGQSLEDAMNSGNQNRKNQVLFTIMQNPSARALVGGTEEEK